MIFSEISIRRPVLATMMSVALVLFGLVALARLPVRELPDIDPPIVTVTTILPGANAEVVETEVTERLEEVINSIEGIKSLTSESREQVSNIIIEFNLSRPIELAAQDVRDRVARVRGLLPDDIEEPIVAKQDADAQPVIWVALFSDKFSTLDLTTIAENTMKDRLQTVKGVSSIFIGGAKRFAIRVRLDSERMAAHQVTVLDVDTALKSQNVELPSGRVEGMDREMTIKTRGEMKTADEFNQLVIKKDGDAFVRLQDVGRAEVGVEDERSIARFNSKPAVGLGIVKQSKANTIEVAKGIKAEVERMLPLLPAGVETYFPYDESIYVEASIHEVWVTLGIAFVLVVITIFIFLRNVRSTLIPCLTIPVSIVGTFAVLGLMGYSINILTMLALVLTIGIVVDDSIVVLENIYRHIEEGMTPMDAAFQGMREIGFAVIAITLTLVTVFIPLAFLTSVTGRLFIEFAIALCGSVVISAFVALSLTPMVSARILQPPGEVHHGSVFNLFERGFDHINHHYERLLRWSLKHRITVGVLSVVAFGMVFWFLSRLDNEFLPEEDKGRLLCFALTPEGSTSEYTDRMVQKLEGIVHDDPNVAGYFSAVALARGAPGKANEGLMFMRLKDGDRPSVQDIVGGPMGLGARFFGEVEGALAFPIIPKAIGRGFGQPFQVVLQDQDLGTLNTSAQDLLNKLRAAGFLMNVRTTYEVNKPELRVDIDRNRAAALAVSVENISRTLQILFGGLDLSKVKLGGKEYDVIAQLERASRLTPSDLDKLYVRNDKGELVQLSSVVSYKTGAGPNAINHYNRFRSATIEGTPMGIPLGTAMDRVSKILKNEYPGLRYEWAGETRDLQEAGQGFLFIIIFAAVITYMVLASQFESLMHPLTIMLTLPLAALGAFGALWLLNGVNSLGTMLFGWTHYAPDAPAFAKWLSAIIPRIPAMNINLFSEVGLVLLIGLATKNSILLVEFANQQREKGKTAMEAMFDAGMIRLRPILMTSFSTILGIMPIAIGFGAGGESRRPMGVAAVGGLLTSTFLTLLVVPVAYTLFSDWSEKFRGVRKKSTALSLLLATGLWLAPSPSAQAAEDQAYDLSRCIATALEQNFDIRAARERILQQDGAVVEVRGQAIPNIGVSGQYSETDEARIQQFGSMESSDTAWNIGIEVTQWLYKGGGNVASIDQQKLLRQAVVEDLARTINEVLLAVRESYYAVLLAREQVKVQVQNVGLLEEELQHEKNKLDVGAVSPFNVLRAEVALANGQTPLIRARNAYKISIEELSRVMGLPQEQLEADTPPIDVVGDLAFQPYEIKLDKALANAREHRPELKSIRSTIEAGERGLRATRAGYLPNLQGFANYSSYNDQFSDDVWDELNGWQAGLRLSWNVFDGAGTRGRVMKAASELAQSRISEESLQASINIEVRRAYSSLLEATELVRATHKVVEQAEESLRLARSRFDAGAATQLDVLQTQVALTEARTNENEALHDYNRVRARLFKAMGIADKISVKE